MTESECNMAAEGSRWRESQARKVAFVKEQKEKAERALEKPCPLCEKKRLDRLHRAEEEKRDWYNTLTRGQQIMAKIRGDYP